MNALTATQSNPALAAIHAPFDALVTITGRAGTGKSTTLVERALRARDALPGGAVAILSAASAHAVQRMQHERRGLGGGHLVCSTLGAVAFEIVKTHRGAEPAATLIDDVRAEEEFARAGSALFSLEWEDVLSAEIDPEITGMRAPERFAGTAYRLIRKLRIAGISPEAFAEAALRGATAFYGNPPNLAAADLIEKTPAKYRDSLRVDAAELARQHAREVDLSKILARLYRLYVDRLARVGCMTAVDALSDAADLLAALPDVRAASSARFALAFVDDAQDLTRGDVRFLRALFGEKLRGVTLAGDNEQRTLAFCGPRADGILEEGPLHFELRAQLRAEPAIAAAVRTIVGAPPQERVPNAVLHRAKTMRAEAAYVASSVAAAIADGVAPSRIAVIARSLRCVDEYVAALLDRNVPVDVAGEGSLFAFADVEDGLAALWSVADPNRNDWLLRNLEAPWLRLSDATIALLCGEPADAQTLLFELPEDAGDDRERRWDRRRDFRPAWNVLRGDRDSELSDVARERLAAFRRARRTWLERERDLDAAALAGEILRDTLLAGAGDDARARLRRALGGRLLSDVRRFVAAHPRATLHDYLLHTQHIIESDDDLLCVERHDLDAVAVLGVEAAKGLEFDRVFVVDVRAGAFPRYFVPEAFGFLPSWGMIPKENVGDAAVAARTAKFTYLQHKLTVPARYYAEERRALYCAASRAREFISVSASGRATRGIGAPEFLEELRASFGEV